jgi:hypothetical protein
MRVLFPLLAVITAALATMTAAEAEPPSPADAQADLVEDYSYPGADAILATYGVQLISGDGHVVFADCATAPDGDIGVLQVRTTAAIGADGTGVVCFKVLAAPGTLRLSVPAVFEIRGDGRVQGTGHAIVAQLTTDAGVHSTVNVNPSGSTPVGIGTSSGSAPTTLLELDVAS